MKTKVLVLAALVAVLAAVVVGVIAAKPADAFPSKAKDCADCHGTGGYDATVTATPSASGVAPGATYTVAITISENPNGAFNTGYWVANSDVNGVTGTSTGVYGGDTGTQQTHTATMTAPTTPGTYYYKVFGEDGHSDDQGIVGFKVYSITVVAPVHDLAVFGIARYPRRADVTLGGHGSYYAVYANVGTVGETFTATLTAKAPGGGTSTLDTRSITLAAGTSTTVYYPGVLTYSSAGTWTVTASAGPVAGETATADNVESKTCTISAASPPASAKIVHRGPASRR